MENESVTNIFLHIISLELEITDIKKKKITSELDNNNDLGPNKPTHGRQRARGMMMAIAGSKTPEVDETETKSAKRKETRNNLSSSRPAYTFTVAGPPSFSLRVRLSDCSRSGCLLERRRILVQVRETWRHLTRKSQG